MSLKYELSLEPLYISAKKFSNHEIFLESHIHTMEYAGFVGSKFRALCDQICTTQGPEVNCVRQVDFS